MWGSQRAGGRGGEEGEEEEGRLEPLREQGQPLSRDSGATGMPPLDPELPLPSQPLLGSVQALGKQSCMSWASLQSCVAVGLCVGQAYLFWWHMGRFSSCGKVPSAGWDSLDGSLWGRGPAGEWPCPACLR